MSWIKIDDQFADHPKVMAAGPLAAWLYVCGLTYCGRYLTDGFIPAPQIRKLADVDDPQSLADKLVEVGLWDRMDSGYLVHDYLEYNPPAAKVKADREANAQRQAEWRERNRDGNGQFTKDERNSVRNALLTTAPSPSPSPSPGPQPVPDDKTASSSNFISTAITEFETEIGIVTSAQVADIKDMLDELEERGLQTWWASAMKIAADQNKRSWAYVKGILNNCIREGKAPGTNNKHKSAHRSTAIQAMEELLASGGAHVIPGLD